MPIRKVDPEATDTLDDWAREYWWREMVQAEKREAMGAMNALTMVGVSVLVLWMPVLVLLASWASGWWG